MYINLKNQMFGELIINNNNNNNNNDSLISLITFTSALSRQNFSFG